MEKDDAKERNLIVFKNNNTFYLLYIQSIHLSSDNHPGMRDIYDSNSFI